MDVGQATARLLAAIQDLPTDLLQVIEHGSNAQYLEAITTVAGNHKYTDHVVTTLDCLLVEIIARWNVSHGANDSIPLFGRILQNTPYLAELAQNHLATGSIDGYLQLPINSQDDDLLLEILLGLHRLLVYDLRTFRKLVKVAEIQQFLSHRSRAIRYLAIRCISLCLSAADAATQQMINAHLGSEAVLGKWEGKDIDYRFFSLWEERRYKDLALPLNSPLTSSETSTVHIRRLESHDMSDTTIEIAGVLLPRTVAETQRPSRHALVHVETAITNLRCLAEALLHPDPSTLR